MESDSKNNEKRYIGIYKKKGYTTNYIINKNQLVDSVNSQTYSPKEVYIVAKYMFEDVNNPSDNSILLVLKTSNGSKGTLLFKNSIKKNSSLTDFFDAVPKKNILNNDNLF